MNSATVRLVEQLVRLGKGIIKAMEIWLREQRRGDPSLTNKSNTPS